MKNEINMNMKKQTYFRKLELVNIKVFNQHAIEFIRMN